MRVSFLVPVLNRVDMLPDCLNSIRAQTITDWECVIVDGGSTDGTEEVIAEFASADRRFHHFTTDAPGKGYLPDFRRCVDEARGQFGKFVYSDDTIAPTFLADTLPHMTDDVALAYTPAMIGATPDTARLAYVHPLAPGKIPRSRFLADSLGDSPHVPVSPGCAIFRMNDLRLNQLGASYAEDFPVSGTDLLLFLLTADEYPFVYAHDEPLAFFRAHPGSVSIAQQTEVQAGYAKARAWFLGDA